MVTYPGAGLRAAPLQMQILPRPWALCKALQKKSRGAIRHDKRGPVDSCAKEPPTKKGKWQKANAGATGSLKKTQEQEIIPKEIEIQQNNQEGTANENQELTEAPPLNKDKGAENQVVAPQGSPLNPSYAEITRPKQPESAGSSEDETLERPTKRAGRKSRKELREEEAERLKVQGNQSTIEMSMGKNTRSRPPKGGPSPSS
jgi:hypothetical protein